MSSYRKITLKDGSASYNFRVVRSGFPTLYKSFPTLKEGKAWAADIESKRNRGKAHIVDPNSVLVFDAIEAFIENHPHASKREIGRCKALQNDFDGFAVSNLTHERVAKYLKVLSETVIPSHPKKTKSHYLYDGDRERTYAPATIRKFYYQLKKCIEWHATLNGYFLSPMVFENQQIPAAWDGKRERRLEKGEEGKLYRTAKTGLKQQDDWPDLIAFALETAMRAQEMLFFTVSNFDAKNRTINLPAEIVKTGKGRQIPLSKAALEIVKRRIKGKGKQERVFDAWRDSDHLSQGFKRLTYRAGIADLKIHDLRHEATSRFFEKGKLSDMQIMKITGHTNYETLSGYTHLRPSSLVDLMD